MAFGCGFSIPAFYGAASGLGMFASASLYLDFTNGNQALDPRITFSRDSNATRTNSAGLIAYAPHNLLTYSEQFDNAAWVKNNATVTPNVVIAPDGTLTADSLAKSVAFGQARQQIPVINGTYTGSFYVKAGTEAVCSFAITENGTATILIRGSINLSTGVVSNSTGTFTAENVGNGWWRLVGTTTTTTSTNISLIAYSGNYGGTETGTVFVWGAQLNVGELQPYYPTTSAAYYGPRFDYDPVTLQPKGLLIEEQRTNLLLQSQFASGWAFNAATSSWGAATTAPDGTATALPLVDTSNTVAGYVYQSISFTTGTAYTMSVYVKKGTCTNFVITSFTQPGQARFNLTTETVLVSGIASNALMTSVGNGWYRCSCVFTANATASNNVGYGDYDVVNTGTLFTLWGAQLEAGAFPTSYIPTTSAQVTRAADVATMTGTNFSSWYNQSEGTLFVEGETPTSASGYLASLGSGGVGTRMSVYPFGGGWGWYVRDAFVDQAAITSSVFSSGVFAKFSGAYKANDFAVSANGSSVATDTSGVVPVVNRLHIGNNNASFNFSNGHIKRLAYYPKRLSDTELQAITS